MDAFVHVLEQYLTYPADAPLQDRLAVSILATLIEVGPRTLATRMAVLYSCMGRSTNCEDCCRAAAGGGD